MQQKVLKKKLVLKKQIKQLLSKVLLTIIIFLVGMIIVKDNPKTKIFIQENIYEKSFKFTKIKNLYQKYFGNIFSIENLIYEELPVFSEQMTYTSKNTYKDGVALTVQSGYMVPSLEKGIVVYIGEKEEYGQTIIIEQTNGIDVFYSNITTEDIKLYDYIEKGEYIGQTKTDKLYLVFQKNGTILDYKDYI